MVDVGHDEAASRKKCGVDEDVAGPGDTSGSYHYVLVANESQVVARVWYVTRIVRIREAAFNDNPLWRIHEDLAGDDALHVQRYAARRNKIYGMLGRLVVVLRM